MCKSNATNDKSFNYYNNSDGKWLEPILYYRLQSMHPLSINMPIKEEIHSHPPATSLLPIPPEVHFSTQGQLIHLLNRRTIPILKPHSLRRWILMAKMRGHQPIKHAPLTQAFFSPRTHHMLMMMSPRLTCIHLHPRLAGLVPEALAAGTLAVSGVGHELLDHDGGVGRERWKVVGNGLVGREKGLGLEIVGVLRGGDVGVVEG